MTERVTPHHVPEPEEAPRWMYRISTGRLRYTHVDSGKVVYAADGGSSLVCAIPGGREVERQKNTRVDVSVCQQGGGRDEWHRVFSGLISRAHTEEDGITDLEAFGPRTSLDSRYFVRRVVYQGIRFDTFMADIAERIRGRGVRIDLRGGGNFRIDKRPYQGETKLLEAVEQISESALNIVADRPGMVLLIAPTPRPGVRSNELGRRLEIGPKDYEPGNLKTPPKEGGPYGQVIVFRRAEDSGNNVIEELAMVNASGEDADLNQVYFIPEFTGTPAQAATTAYRMANQISKGMHEPSVKSLLFRRPLYTFDPVLLVQEIDEGPRGTLRIPYDTLVSESTLDLADGTYDLKLDGLKGRPSRRRPAFEPDTLSPYLRRTTGAML